MRIFYLAFLGVLQVQFQICSAWFGQLERDPPEPINPASNPPEAYWFDQKLDHFDKSNTKTWKQRYYYSDAYYNQLKDTPYGDQLPLFVKIGGEDGIKGQWVNGGLWVEIGLYYGALFVYLEHRYYGESHPTEDMSTENMKYLSSRQGMEDLIYFIDGIKKQYGMTDKNKVVVFGGSYPGALAAWIRLKYPDKVLIAHASSAPLELKYDFSEYHETSKKSMAAWDTECASNIQKAAAMQVELMKTNDGLSNISETFHTCVNLSEDYPLDILQWFKDQGAVIGKVIQYNGTKPLDIPKLCDYMKSSDDVLEALAYTVRAAYLNENNSTCTGSNFEGVVAALSNVTFGKSNARQWTWQTCNEFGYFQTSESSKSLFDNTFGVKIYEETCKSVFGEKYTPDFIKKQVAKANKYYGGKNYKQDKVIFTQGSLDQWQTLGISKGNGKYEAIVIENACHVEDEGGTNANDSQPLKDAKIKIKETLERWIPSMNFKQYATG